MLLHIKQTTKTHPLMRTYIQTIVILLVTALFFSCESDPVFEDFETANNTLNFENIEGVEDDEEVEATSNNNRSEETNVEEDDLPPAGDTKVEEDDLPPIGRTNNENVEEDDLPPAEKKKAKEVEEDDLPPSGN